MLTLADKIIESNRSLDFKGELPQGIRIMNPFRESKYIMQVSSAFYRKYYDDNAPRRLILGINPGRFGAGFTGIPFTDTKRLTGDCGIEYTGRQTHEMSSVFVYEVIKAYGGPDKFYKDFYISAVCPLGFTMADARGKEKNFNYYDRPDLTTAVMDLITRNIRKQIEMRIRTDVCLCLGKGKNEKFLLALNERYHFFKKIIALEHPRWVMQYRARYRQEYVRKYIEAIGSIERGR
jgi:hypothetical protein